MNRRVNGKDNGMWPRILPFAIYMAFIGVGSLVAEWVPGDQAFDGFALWLYPVKTLIVGLCLVYCWPRYEELQGPIMKDWGEGLQVLGVGLVVYVLWVRMDWSWAMQGNLTGYNPFQAGPSLGLFLGGMRLFGASVVVPVMEELFWRSFLIRWIANAQFKSIPLGTVTLNSFLITVVLFGLEHNLWLAGMMAGGAYTLLLYRTRRLWPCILAHAVTNLALGIHVLLTGEWHWW